MTGEQIDELNKPENQLPEEMVSDVPDGSDPLKDLKEPSSDEMDEEESVIIKRILTSGNVSGEKKE